MEEWERLSFCPICGSRALNTAFEGRQVNAVCSDCGTCWHVDGDTLQRVDRLACPGCDFRPLCIAALAERSP